MKSKPRKRLVLGSVITITSARMEGGSNILACNYTGDHLATSDMKQNKRLWIGCGFNAFGQLYVVENERKIQNFKEIAINANVRNLKCSWSYSVSANECSLRMYGFIHGQTKNTKTVTADNSIKSLASCDRYCLLLLKNGSVFKYGVQCLEGQLEELIFQTNEIFTPKKISIFGDPTASSCTSHIKIDHIACGNNIMVALGKWNEVFTGTTQVHRFPKHVRIQQLVCGFEHALLLTYNGDIYSWGNGLGQLGLDVIGIEEKPVLLEAMAGIKIKCIAASGWHSAAISTFSDLYTWGFNSNGQLGLRIYKTGDVKEPALYVLPQLIDTANFNCCEAQDGGGCYPIKVVCGARHTIVLMNCGSIYATGWNAYGQLGLKNSTLYTDKFVCVLKIENIIDDDVEIVCGPWNTLIGMHKDGKYLLNDICIEH
ncbi:E3 ISG15--protein ligase Herc6 isoform X2 [Musca autumnalis]|uniref:E3 ISG15--protein ligase Herc6 isoform X2 n=1 Tax=Musca autumnalis TaxID=221902 RepID=UPI003CED3074